MGISFPQTAQLENLLDQIHPQRLKIQFKIIMIHKILIYYNALQDEAPAI